jgi:hypothetical protein
MKPIMAGSSALRSADQDPPDTNRSNAGQSKIFCVVTEIGFVSLLVAGFGALAGGLVYVAMRVARGRS